MPRGGGGHSGLYVSPDQTLSRDNWNGSGNGWPDATAGILWVSGNPIFFAPTDDGHIGRSPGTFANPWVPSGGTKITMTSPTDGGWSYQGGGKIIMSGSTPVMFYHAEYASGTDHFFAQLGIATGNSTGSVWTDKGVILTPQSVYNAGNHYYVDMGSPCPVLDPTGTYWYVFFKDVAGDISHYVSLGVARCLKSTFDAAIAGNTLPAFTKYSSGSFSTSGLGGTADSLWIGGTTWFDVVFSVPLNKYLLFICGGNTSEFNLGTSTDGITWANRGIFAPGPPTFPSLINVFPTVLDPNSTDSTQVVSDQYSMYYAIGTGGLSGNTNHMRQFGIYDRGY